MRIIFVIGFSIGLLILGACSMEDEPSFVEDDHVWRSQTQVLDRAREVEQVLQDSAQQKRQAIERQAQ
ncbi:MAG: hypothetical protein ACE5K1_06770 [Acidiferrobacterales bacterium]